MLPRAGEKVALFDSRVALDLTLPTRFSGHPGHRSGASRRTPATRVTGASGDYSGPVDLVGRVPRLDSASARVGAGHSALSLPGSSAERGEDSPSVSSRLATSPLHSFTRRCKV